MENHNQKRHAQGRTAGMGAVGLLLTLLVAGSGASLPLSGSPAPVTAGSCGDVDMSGGMGGQRVSCTFPCAKGSMLSGEVASVDPDADTGVGVACGGEGGAAACPVNVCVTAAGPSQYRDDSGKCNGESQEFWDSGIAVACVGVDPDEPIDPHEEICRVYPDFPTCDDAGGIRWLCIAANPWVLALEPALIDDSFPARHSGDVILSMTTFRTLSPNLATSGSDYELEAPGLALATFYDSGVTDTSGASPAQAANCNMKLYRIEREDTGGLDLVEVVDFSQLIEPGDA